MKSNTGYIQSKINDHPVSVTYTFTPGVPFRRTGFGAGDCDPEEPDEAEITDITDENGVSIYKWVSDADVDRISRECIQYELSERCAA